jgi:hypothetical protein
MREETAEDTKQQFQVTSGTLLEGECSQDSEVGKSIYLLKVKNIRQVPRFVFRYMLVLTVSDV